MRGKQIIIEKITLDGRDQLMETTGPEKIFLNTKYLKIMYFLAKNNPKITIETIEKKLKIPKEKAELILNEITYLHLAKLEENKGYSLTQEGLAALYNFHINYNEPQKTNE